MIERVPKTVSSRGRVYTSERQRRHIDVNDSPYGRGTDVEVGLVVTDTSPDWGTLGHMATYEDELGYYGEVRIPQDVRSTLGLAEGDDCLLTVIAQ